VHHYAAEGSIWKGALILCWRWVLQLLAQIENDNKAKGNGCKSLVHLSVLTKPRIVPKIGIGTMDRTLLNWVFNGTISETPLTPKVHITVDVFIDNSNILLGQSWVMKRRPDFAGSA
jgi:hypothetical protein